MIQIYDDVPIFDKTSFKTGGAARYYVKPSTVDEIIECIAWADSRKEPVLIIGKGTNILVSDNGWPGLVIDDGAQFDAITWNEDRARCNSGAALNRLIREMIDRRLCGLEHLSGIPGSIGGAVVMNAGSYGHSVSECIKSVDFYDYAEKRINTLPIEQLEAGYRRTVFHAKKVFILSCNFCFKSDENGSAEDVFKECIAKRKEKHPLDLPNCGSIFKNINGIGSAASLIEKCGLKGLREGNVEVSRKHANFMVNLGQGTADDVRHLIVQVQKAVYEKQGVLLEPEVIFAGEFGEKLFVPKSI
jgi:UDP-N-acetylmuramate dehydrogenase